MKNKKIVKKLIILLLLICICILGTLLYISDKDLEEVAVDPASHLTEDEKFVLKNEALEEIITGEEVKFVKETSDGTRQNTSNKIQEKHLIEGMDGLEIISLALTGNNGNSTLVAKVKNTTGNDIGDKMVTLEFRKENGQYDIEVGIYIPTIPAGQEMDVTTVATLDFINTYDYTAVAK